MDNSLVKRQAAIDGLKGYIDDTGVFNQDRWFVHGIKTAITHLKGTPSAQPETCEYYDAESHFCALNRPSAQQESTRTFVELVVKYPDPELCIYKEYKGKPYYSIKYIENGETHVGYGTYKPEVLSQFLKEYFIPFAQPEIIHCKECKFAHMTYDGDCKYCDVWFPDESEYLDGDYFCASAERRTDDANDIT